MHYSNTTSNTISFVPCSAFQLRHSAEKTGHVDESELASIDVYTALPYADQNDRATSTNISPPASRNIVAPVCGKR